MAFRSSRAPRCIALVAIAVFAACHAKRAPRAIVPRIGAKQTGMASWYGDPYHGRATASGEIYDMEAGTAAHRRYAFGTRLRVDNLDNGKRTEVRVIDRGPFVRGRIVDLSRAAAREIEMLGPGTAKVRLTVIAASPLRRDNDRRWLVQVASFRDPQRAHALAARLMSPDRRAEVRETGSGWYRVTVAGPNASEAEAKRIVSDMRREFPEAMLVAQP